MGERASRNYAGLTKAQRDALARVAFSVTDRVQVNPRTAAKLIERDLMYAYTEQSPLLFGGGAMLTVKLHAMTPAQHMDYCAWCASQPDDNQTNRGATA